MSNRVSCGIDFGTSNSTVAVSQNGNAALIPLEDGKTTLPSALFFPDRGSILFGRRAISTYMSGEDGRLMRGLKKVMGTSLMDDRTQISGRTIKFTDILASFIKHLKSSADQQAQSEIINVVLGRPVHFHDENAEADKKSQETLEEIARNSGFKNIQFLFEPIAAAFAHEAKVEREKLTLVVDLGGGTSDFTIIKISNKSMKKSERSDDVLATSGIRVGGTTFDSRLSLKSFMPELGYKSKYTGQFDKDKILTVPSGIYFDLSEWSMVNSAQTRKAISQTMELRRNSLQPEKINNLLQIQENHLGHALLEGVEECKIALTDIEFYDFVFKKLSHPIEYKLTRRGFESAIQKDVLKIENCILDCLRQARVKSDAIELIIMTGGSTELPIINDLIRKLFPSAEISQGNKLDSVGLGLAYHAGNIFGH